MSKYTVEDLLKKIEDTMKSNLDDFIRQNNSRELEARQLKEMLQTERKLMDAVMEERDRYRRALEQAIINMKNARGAVESNQIADKDVWGTLTRGIAGISTALETTNN